MEILNVFNTLTLKKIFWKTKIVFNKLEDRFSIESTKIENATLLCKTNLSKANVTTNRMGSTKWTCRKERSFPSNYFPILKILFQLKNLVWRVDLMDQRINCLYSYFSKASKFLFFFRVLFLFSLWLYLNNVSYLYARL